MSSRLNGILAELKGMPQKDITDLESRRPVRGMKKKPTQNSEGSQFGKPHNTVKEKPNMAKQRQVNNEEPVELTDDDRDVLIETIVGNCACQEEERETLN